MAGAGSLDAPWRDYWIGMVRQHLDYEEAHRRRERCRRGWMMCMAGLLEEGRQGCVPGLSYDFFPLYLYHWTTGAWKSRTTRVYDL